MQQAFRESMRTVGKSESMWLPRSATEPLSSIGPTKRFEGSRTIAHEAFGKIGRSRRSKPPAEYTIASQLINEAD